MTRDLQAWLMRKMIAEELKAARKRKKMSRRRLARNSGVSERTIVRLENAEAPLDVEHLIALAEALGETLALFRAAWTPTVAAPWTRRRTGKAAVAASGSR